MVQRWSDINVALLATDAANGASFNVTIWIVPARGERKTLPAFGAGDVQGLKARRFHLGRMLSPFEERAGGEGNSANNNSETVKEENRNA
jgi:hypothetical protein